MRINQYENFFREDDIIQFTEFRQQASIIDVLCTDHYIPLHYRILSAK